MAKLKQTWDLESIFPGGSDSSELKASLNKSEEGIDALREYVATLDVNLSVEELRELLKRIQEVSMGLVESSAFVGCLTAQNVRDVKALLLQGNLGQIGARLGVVSTAIEHLYVTIPEERWAALFTAEELAPYSFILNEQREMARFKMPREQEALAADLAVDGYHAWSRLYNMVVGRMEIDVEVEGKREKLSVGQATNLLSHPDPMLRRAAFTEIEAAFSKEAELCASALNHLAGFRLNLYKNRDWEDILWEPLQGNRMQRSTLDAMWQAVEKGKPSLLLYLRRKAELLGLKQLAWYDLNAPLGAAGKKIPFDEAANFVVEQLGKFSPEIADFTRNALDKRWVEAEDRGGKRPGAFCTSLPKSGESRVFMTYSGTIKSLGTLAHELGHAYHGHVLRDVPLLLRRYAMNVAETASIFNELLVVDGALAGASTPEERLGILDDKIGSSVAFFMDIHSRFLFETRFYAERRSGLLSVDRLNELMLQAQRDAFRDGLSDYHPHFWASKLHFYSTGVPFYNFPYTFGYLFSAGVYARAREEGTGFAKSYRELLLDTPRMTVEDLARKHLGVDLTKPDFWEAAVQLAVDDVQEFLRLTE